MKLPTDFTLYQKYFNPTELWEKLQAVGKKAGAKVVYAVLLLFYSVGDSNLPLAEKVKIYGALGYFILPLDVFPDFLPGGYADDLTALVIALKSIWDNITPETHAKARTQLEKLFGPVADEDLRLF